jgi:hypothetical protein
MMYLLRTCVSSENYKRAGIQVPHGYKEHPSLQSHFVHILYVTQCSTALQELLYSAVVGETVEQIGLSLMGRVRVSSSPGRLKTFICHPAGACSEYLLT